MNPFDLSSNTRLGFHYFPDTSHYRETDLQTWLPELQSLGCSWLTLIAPLERAIPEYFIRSLVEAQVEPVIHFQIPAGTRPDSLAILLNSYARWGVRYITLFDRPNMASAWPASVWAQSELVERFLDSFLPLAEAVLQAGMIPVFPPLEPGGDYWDLAFLRAALRGIRRRGHSKLIETLALGAAAWAGNRPIDWGCGGPERWPGTRPYFTPEGVQDHLGFRIFDWYLAIARAELDVTCPILLLKAGSRIGDRQDPAKPAVDEESHARRNLALARWMAGGLNLNAQEDTYSETGEVEPVPSEVLACNFWLLAASENSALQSDTWFKPGHSRLPAVTALKHWLAGRRIARTLKTSQDPRNADEFHFNRSSQKNLPGSAFVKRSRHPINHYLLLPYDEWGGNETYLDVMRSFVEKHHPTVGYSLEEAALAKRVTVVGGKQAYPDEMLQVLRSAGCSVERVIADGTVIAP